MATNGKYQNISIQPTKLARTSRTIYELPRENLTEADLVKKSTSDRTKRRVAHEAWFPLPVITKPVVTEKTQQKPIKKLVIKKDGSIIWRVKPRKASQITEAVTEVVVMDSARAQRSQSSSSGVEGVNDRVKADKRKSADLNCDEVIKRSKKKSDVDTSKNKDVKTRKKSRSHKGVDDGVKADKKKSEDIDCVEVIKRSKKKSNVDTSKNKDVKTRKKSRSHKA